jgi:hypothetical protein
LLIEELLIEAWQGRRNSGTSGCTRRVDYASWERGRLASIQKDRAGGTPALPSELRCLAAVAFDKFDWHSDGLFLCPRLPPLLQLCWKSWLEIMD